MFNRLKICASVALSIAILSGGYSAAFAQTTRTASSALEAGTVIPVKLETELTSNKSEQGDKFTATVKADDRGYFGIPSGSTIEGVVREARAKRGKEPGVLDLAFQRLRLPNGRTYPIDGSLIGLDGDSVTRDADGRMVAKPGKRNNRMSYAGIGAAGGAIASILGGKGRLRIENVLIGAGIGYIIGALEKSPSEVRDVRLKPGTEMGVRLDRRLTYAGYDREDETEFRYQEDGRADRLERRRDPSRPQTERRTGTSGANGGNGTSGKTDRAERIGVLADDQDVRFDMRARPLMNGDIVMLPIQRTLEALGATSSYDEEAQEITVRGKKGEATILVGSRIVVIDGERRVRLESPVRLINDRLYAPMAFFTLVTEYQGKWEARSKTVLFTHADRGDADEDR